jgi:hypothetical protein
MNLFDENIINWLLEDKNPDVKLRTQIELLSLGDREVEITRNQLKESAIFEKNLLLLYEEKPWSICYALTALAEWGLTKEDVDINKYVDRIIDKTGFKLQCGEGMLLRTLVKLGYSEYERVNHEINDIFKLNTDGGFRCISKNKKINDPKKAHKSCYRITATYLLLLAELNMHGIKIEQEEDIVDYFLKRNVLYRTDNPDTIVVDKYDGSFFPTDCINHGIQETLYALSVLGVGNNNACEKAWNIANTLRGDTGRYTLTHSQSKPYFKVGAKGKENKWVTLYMLLAEKYCAI